MFEIMTALHLLTAVLVIGPLVHAVTTAARGVRQRDAGAIAASARMTRIYAFASIVVVIFGFGLMSAKSPYTGEAVATFGQTWIWLSALLWLIGAAIALAVTAPALTRAGASIGTGAGAAAFKGKVLSSGIVVAVIFVAIIVLMVYQPGS